MKLICKQCGAVFHAPPSRVKNGGGKFCSISCATRYRNLYSNPTRSKAVRVKISQNHADVSGKNNPMYGRRGDKAPSFIDGRSSFKGERYRRIIKASGVKEECAICGARENLHVHHRDGNHKNNDINNLTYLCLKCHYTLAHEHIRDSSGRFIGATLKQIV